MTKLVPTFSGRARKGKALDFSAIIVIDLEREDTPENAIADDATRRMVQILAIISVFFERRYAAGERRFTTELPDSHLAGKLGRCLAISIKSNVSIFCIL